MPTPESWYVLATEALERAPRPAVPISATGPTDCGKYCGSCDSCVEFEEDLDNAFGTDRFRLT